VPPGKRGRSKFGFLKVLVSYSKVGAAGD